MKTIELTKAEAENVVMFLKGMSDHLTTLHKDAQSETAKLLWLSGVQEVDRLVVNISEQTEAQA